MTALQTYIAISACGQWVKVGRSRDPVKRVRTSQSMRVACRILRARRPLDLVRVYPTDVERDCHRFLAPDRVERKRSPYREWFRVGPRLRILVNRLDRKPRRLP